MRLNQIWVEHRVCCHGWRERERLDCIFVSSFTIADHIYKHGFSGREAYLQATPRGPRKVSHNILFPACTFYLVQSVMVLVRFLRTRLCPEISWRPDLLAQSCLSGGDDGGGISAPIELTVLISAGRYWPRRPSSPWRVWVWVATSRESWQAPSQQMQARWVSWQRQECTYHVSDFLDINMLSALISRLRFDSTFLAKVTTWLPVFSISRWL